MGARDGQPEIFLEVPLVELTPVPRGEPGDWAVRMQYTEIAKGGMGFVLDVLEHGETLLSSGMDAKQGVFLALYLLGKL